MNLNKSNIIFLDNSIQKIFKTIDSLKSSIRNLIVFHTEIELLQFLEHNKADVIFLNLDLQPNDGIAVLKEISQLRLIQTPYLILYTDKQDDFLQELAYNSGADAFIGFQSKPLIMELFLQNLLWRRGIQFPKNTQKQLHIDAERYLVFKNGVPVQLPRKEFQLLELLQSNTEKFFTKPEIASQIWNDNSIAGKRIIDVHIYNLRRYFGKQCILSQKGKGYRFNRKLLA